MDTPSDTPNISSPPAAPSSHKGGAKITNQRRAWIWGGLGALGLVLFAVVIWLLFFNKPKAATLVTASVVYADVEQTVLSTGVLVPFVEINVGSRASGLVTSLKVDVGDTVRKGDVIAQIDSATQTNSLTTAQAALQDIEAQKIGDQASLDEAQTAYDRQASLYHADAGSKADYDLAIKAVKSARAVLTSVNAQIKQGQVSVKTAEVNLGYTRILAPIDGTVLDVVTKEGQTVNAAQSAPTIVTLGQLDKMTIEAEIAEADVINITPGMSVYFTILGAPDHRYYGHIRKIEPAPTTFTSEGTAASTATASAVYYYGLFEVDNPDGRLKTTMTANVSIVQAQAKHVLTIPSSALGEQGQDGRYLVKVVVKDKSSERKVSIGLNDGSNAQVVAGLVAGETVVVGETSASSSSSSSSSRSRGSGTGNGGGL